MSNHVDIKENKRYAKVNLSEDQSIFSEGYYQNYEIPDSVQIKLARELGISRDAYDAIKSISVTYADTIVKAMSKKSDRENISLLLDEEKNVVVNYSVESPRTPVLNSEFMNRLMSIAEANDHLSVEEVYYTPEDTISSVIFRRKAPIVIEEKFEGKPSRSTEYDVGILIMNDELNSVSTRLAVYIKGQPLYLPASYYSATNSRYKRSTSSSIESLEVLLLKVVDDLRGEDLQDKIYDFHFRYRANKDIITSYEEYNSVLRAMRKIPSIIEDNSFLDSLVARYENFERKYSHLDEQKSSYIWRCTAMSDITIDALVSLTASILRELCAPPIEYFYIRDLLGAYVSTNRIAAEIAREDL